MRKIIPSLIIFLISPALAWCQANAKIANEAYVITRMVNKFHVDPRPIDDAFSANVFKGMLDKTDADKVFFTQTDISRLGACKKTIDDEIKQRKTGFLNLFISIYSQRLKQADSVISIITQKPIELYLSEKYTVTEDTVYPANVAAMQSKFYKIMKADVIDYIIDDLPGHFKTFAPAKQKKYVDSAVAVLQKKVSATLKRKVDNLLQNPYGLPQYIGNLYCETIASCFDPHTEFLPPEEKENLESELGKQPFRFGFTMKADKDGGVLIDNLQPGSPAYKGGKLNTGDKFITVQYEGGQPVDVSDMSTREFSELMEQSNHKKVVFTVKKGDGSTVQVPLQKEQVADNDEEDRVKSFILKGGNTIGYIYLPAFYQDWETANQGLNGCANDVGREIIKLKKENINGLIIDLRYNGGGSAEEATELAGIFIDAGPVEQIKDRGPKVYTMKDVDRGTIYDGPLVILVNGASASASELLAGTLQDYNRAVIIGAPTYGKATAQVIFPMDTTVTFDNLAQTQTDNYIKITTSKLYRVNGTTAQFSGVQPDIVLPDVLDAYITKESAEPTALRPSTIEANKYYTPYPPLPVKALAAGVQTSIDTCKYFNTIKNFITYYKQQKVPKDVSLNFKDALALNQPGTKDDDAPTPAGPPSTRFTVQNNQYETPRIMADAILKEQNEDFSKQIAADAYISIAYDVLLKLKP